MRRSLATIILTAALAACAGPPEAVVPTATPPPTATPQPTATPSPAPTATPPPTATPAPSATSVGAQTGASGPLADALRRTAALDTYSATISVAGGGFPGAPAGALGTLLRLDGRFAGAEHEFTASGLLTSVLGADPVTGLTAARADGASYVRGPVPLLGIADQSWYRLPPERAALAQPPVSLALLRGVLDPATFDSSGLTAGAPEQREGQSCTPYTGDTAVTAAVLRSLYAGGLPQVVAPEQVREGEATVVICDDGYVHQLTLSLAGVFPGDTAAPFSLELDARLDNPGGPIEIAAPPAAKDLPASSTP